MIVRVKGPSFVVKLVGAVYGLGIKVRGEVISLSRMSRFV